MSDTHFEYKGASSDISPKANTVIWSWFVGLGVFLFLSIWGLDILFQDSVDKEHYEKIGSAVPHELVTMREEDAQVLSGSKGLLSGKKNISIDEAMNRVVKAYQK